MGGIRAAGGRTDGGRTDGRASRIRVALVHGPAVPAEDGVSDYVAHLTEALGAVAVDPVGVPLVPARGGRRLRSDPSDPRPSDLPDLSDPRPSDLPDLSDLRPSDLPDLSDLRPSDRCRADLTGLRAAAARIRRLCPDLVHVQFAPSAYGFSPVPGLLPALLPRSLPIVTTLHEYGWWAAPAWLPHPLWRLTERLRLWDRETWRLAPSSAALVVTNPDHAAAVHRRLGRRPAQIPLAANVEYPAADEADPAADEAARGRRRLGVGDGCFLLVFFGFVHPVKGVRYVIEALPRLLSDHPDLHFAVVGGFTSAALPEEEARAFRGELEDLCRARGVAGAVTFTGHLPAGEVSELLRAADAAVLPFTAGVTLKSGALLAVLGHGLPTAVTLPDDPDGRLRDGGTVAVIPGRRDHEAVAVAVRRLIADEDLRRRLGDAGRRLVAGHSWREVARRHRELYERVLSGV
jgi:glycosyltransferase involved in cell wall biosynthesis